MFFSGTRSTSCMYELTVTVIMKQKLNTRSSIALEKCEILAINNYWMELISSLTEWSCRASCRAELHDVWSRSKEKSTWKPIENKLKQMTRVTRRKNEEKFGVQFLSRKRVRHSKMYWVVRSNLVQPAIPTTMPWPASWQPSLQNGVLRFQSGIARESQHHSNESWISEDPLMKSSINGALQYLPFFAD